MEIIKIIFEITYHERASHGMVELSKIFSSTFLKTLDNYLENIGTTFFNLGPIIYFFYFEFVNLFLISFQKSGQ